MTWKRNPDGSYTNQEFPVKLLSESGIAKFLFLSEVAGRIIPVNDLWYNPLAPIPTSQSLELEIYTEEQSSGVNGGSLVVGDNVRLINAQSVAPSWAGAPSGNQFAITQNGYFLFLFWAVTSETNKSRTFLRDVTNGLDYYSLNASTPAGSTAFFGTPGLAWVNLNSFPTVFELHSYVQTAAPSIGKGYATSVPGVNEIYSQVLVIKVGQ